MDMNKLNKYTLQKQTPHPLQHLQEWVFFVLSTSNNNFKKHVHFNHKTCVCVCVCDEKYLPRSPKVYLVLKLRTTNK